MYPQHVTIRQRLSGFATQIALMTSILTTAVGLGDPLREIADKLSQAGNNPFHHVQEETSKLDFVLEPQGLVAGKLQMSVKIFQSKDQNELPRLWDIDGVCDHLKKGDFVLFAQTAFIFRDLPVERFGEHSLRDPGYIQAAIPEASDIRVFVNSFDKRGFITRRYIGPKKIETISRVESYVPESHKGQAALLDLRPQNLDMPDLITSTHSLDGDISTGSYGGRTTNFYYKIDSQNTLHISRKVFTFKQEPAMKFWPLSRIWKRVEQSAKSSTLQGTLKSLVSISHYLKEKS